MVAVREVMSKQVVNIDLKRSVYEAALILRARKLGCLIVTENSEAVGVISERDIVERLVCENRDASTTPVEEVMSWPLITGSPNWTLEEAARVMTEKKIKKLPIVEKGEVVGILTDTDIMRSAPKLHAECVKVWVEEQWE